MVMIGPKGKKYPTLGTAARSLGAVSYLVGNQLRQFNWLKKR